MNQLVQRKHVILCIKVLGYDYCDGRIGFIKLPICLVIFDHWHCIHAHAQ